MTAADRFKALYDHASMAARGIGFRSVAPALVLLTGGSAMATVMPAYAQKVTERQIVDVLAKNPEIVQRAMLALQHQQQVEQAQQLLTAMKPVSERIIAGDGRIPFIGNPKGRPVVEYFDYNCGYCKKFSKDTATPLLAKNRNVRLNLVLTPILGPGSERMALYAAAAKLQNRFAPAHEFLIAQKAQTVAEAESFRARLIIAASLDKAAFDKALTDGSAKAIVAHNAKLAQQAGVTGTPMLYVNGAAAPGAISLPEIEALLRR